MQQDREPKSSDMAYNILNVIHKIVLLKYRHRLKTDIWLRQTRTEMGTNSRPHCLAKSVAFPLWYACKYDVM
jgi:hypothetical protein